MCSDNSRMHCSSSYVGYTSRPRSALTALFRANTCYPCVVSDWLTLFSETTNEHSRSASRFPPISCTNPSSRQANALPAFTLVSSVAYSSTMKMEATFSFETSNIFQRTIRRHIPENTTFYCGRSSSMLFEFSFQFPIITLQFQYHSVFNRLATVALTRKATISRTKNNG
jgi:hypothetical protein